MGPITVKLVLDEHDFACLLHNSAEWAANAADWEPQVRRGRFRSSEPGLRTGKWKMAYWLGQDYTAVILARAFLTAWGEEFEIVTDEGSDGEWVILTSYEWKREG